MYGYRSWQQLDLPWLQLAAAAAAWESLSPAERLTVTPEGVGAAAAQQLMSILANPQGTAVVALDLFGRPAGYAALALAPDGATGEINGFLVSLWVAPEQRRQGVGQRLLSLAELLLRQAGVRKAKLWVSLGNAGGVALARLAGYRAEGLIGLKSLPSPISVPACTS